MAATQYAPVMICDHGTAGTISFHADQAGAHKAFWHSPDFPVNARMGTRDEHERAGWDVSDFPLSVSM
jgi:hypothetical protein